MRSFLLLLVSLLALSCAGQGPRLEGLEKANRYFEKGDFAQAIEEFKVYLELESASTDVSRAQFMLARSFYENGDYPTAAVEFEVYRRNYPRGDSLELAAYYDALCWVEQSPRFDRDSAPTFRAIRKLEDFLREFPAGRQTGTARGKMAEMLDKLARKKLSIARFYADMGRLEAADIYYELLALEFPESPLLSVAVEEWVEIKKARGLEEEAEELLRLKAEWEGRKDRAP
ncbi:MAG: outer membrane protein assembly factor BamD [Candidatus Krumholzibacteria bacterium]|nr:outer membrane protein assembly factor BamD [Candidatus Krumholzibacteria bacterium]MDP6796409.1 outer membrane protein assembly factor BamD [Candidatus Krumholzibacteria bacterium]MDP7020798.1 outer membrane protein assembly factor BamD [Candidatus Krumholzibacteria bacterium]